MADLAAADYVATQADPSVALRPQLLSALHRFSVHSQNLLYNLSTPHSATTPSPESQIEKLSRLDQYLASLLTQSKTHAHNQARIESLAKSIKEHDQRWRQDVRELEQARRKLGLIVDEGRKDRRKMEAVEQGPVLMLTDPSANIGLTHRLAPTAKLEPEEILALGRRLASFTSAPPLPEGTSLFDHQALPPQALRPFPTEDVMRRGALMFEGLGDVPMGEVRQMGQGEGLCLLLPGVSAHVQ
jgi:hypothetical protein